jgi:hypothetical protein
MAEGVGACLPCEAPWGSMNVSDHKFAHTHTPPPLLRVGACISGLYTQGRSAHLPMTTLRFSCYELGPLCINPA